MLAPAAVLALYRFAPGGGPLHRRMVDAQRRGEAAHREAGRVEEIDAPEGGPSAVAPLRTQQEGDRTALCLAQFRLLRQRRQRAGGMAERGERRCGAFDIRKLGHALAEHLGRVEPFEKGGAATPLIGAEAAVLVLPRQDEADGG